MTEPRPLDLADLERYNRDGVRFTRAELLGTTLEPRYRLTVEATNRASLPLVIAVIADSLPAAVDLTLATVSDRRRIIAQAYARARERRAIPRMTSFL